MTPTLCHTLLQYITIINGETELLICGPADPEMDMRRLRVILHAGRKIAELVEKASEEPGVANTRHLLRYETCG